MTNATRVARIGLRFEWLRRTSGHAALLSTVWAKHPLPDVVRVLAPLTNNISKNTLREWL
ncbi:hypothetical protein AWB68_05335 [Caballeronia choica]|jgi:hypothetical protein|uniref:Uncharacterized protein n=1 Tax=Caballeronia choica TaxID=326476 RepID=A0A158KAI8_9BURK|nr:hypothetical protein AWB68_05335 [Caballeronia choica]